MTYIIFALILQFIISEAIMSYMYRDIRKKEEEYLLNEIGVSKKDINNYRTIKNRYYLYAILFNPAPKMLLEIVPIYGVVMLLKKNSELKKVDLFRDGTSAYLVTLLSDMQKHGNIVQIRWFANLYIEIKEDKRDFLEWGIFKDLYNLESTLRIYEKQQFKEINDTLDVDATKALEISAKYYSILAKYDKRASEETNRVLDEIINKYPELQSIERI